MSRPDLRDVSYGNLRSDRACWERFRCHFLITIGLRRQMELQVQIIDRVSYEINPIFLLNAVS
ncbi:hypothetical protein [Dactylococcopsis salina]|uniref:hypothetical protein n=1 Tax=Dactylococcopsis salina TaxID=292566 RepID=UPI0002EC393E|nr:hypothetical protein [Dactylococcopsis salina]